MPVLDASAILNSFPFKFERGKRYLTVPEVIDEFKDFRSKAVAQAGIDQGFLLVTPPSSESVARAVKAGEGLGLSETDVKVLALALEKREEIWTDDHGLQKAARTLGVKSMPVIHKKA